MLGSKRIVDSSSNGSSGGKKYKSDRGFKTLDISADATWIKDRNDYSNNQNINRHTTFPTWHITSGKSIGIDYEFHSGVIKVLVRQYTPEKTTTLTLTVPEWLALENALERIQKFIYAVEGRLPKTPEKVLKIETLKANEKGWKSYIYNIQDHDLEISLSWHSDQKSAIARIRRGTFKKEEITLSACGLDYLRIYITERVQKGIKMWEKVSENAKWGETLVN